MGKGKIRKLQEAVDQMNKPMPAPMPLPEVGQVGMAAEKPWRDYPNETLAQKRAKLIAAHVALEAIKGGMRFEVFQACETVMQHVAARLGEMELTGR